MKRILVPTRTAEDWKPLLAKPDLHWKSGRSAMCAAASWEDAAAHLPREILSAFERAAAPELEHLELLLAIPEYQTELPGGSTASHTDVLAVARNGLGLVVITVEAKVDEPFGPTLGKKRVAPSPGQEERFDYLHSVLGLASPLPDSIRYQLLHRTASAVLAARTFHAATAVMMVQSFSPEERWKEDFDAFVRVMGAEPLPRQVVRIPSPSGPALYLGWCQGDDQYRRIDFRTEV